MPAWVKLAGTHANVEWHVPHAPVVVMWFGPCPAAFVPSWQDTQVPVTSA